MENSVPNVLSDVTYRDRGRILAALVSRMRDLELAEDALQQATVAALVHWERAGIPHAPTAWLIKVALNKGIDTLRLAGRESRKAQELGYILPNDDEALYPEDIPDERLRLIFTCCHPALEEKSRAAWNCFIDDLSYFHHWIYRR